MGDIARKKGMFPSKQRRWCTELLKVKPLAAHLQALMDTGADIVSAVGIRAAESEARAKMPEWEWSDLMDCEVWRPLIRWTEQDVIDIHQRHGLRPNPLYLLGAERVGCWPCIHSRKSEIRLIADSDPGRIAELRALEVEVTTAARAVVEARGETLKHARTWFQAPLGGEGTWPIDKVVDWARTSHGGRQFEMFAAAGRDAGCVRWGLCDTGADAIEKRKEGER
jgi:3'-phosphoadenosine 5'-phosphosulfate sulfotransferase (PAPS reductase)/FAD synthetase